jgi:hypothetical protein
MHVVSALLLAVWWDAQFARWAVWGGLVLLTVALLLLIRTRWGQQPLSKCVVLSLLAHVLVGIYMTTVNIVSGPGDGAGSGVGSGVDVALVDGSFEFGGANESSTAADGDRPQWDAITGEEQAPLDAPALEPFLAPSNEPIAEPTRETPPDAAVPELASLPERPVVEEAPAPESIAKSEPLVRSVSERPTPTELPVDSDAPADLTPMLESAAEAAALKSTSAADATLTPVVALPIDVPTATARTTTTDGSGGGVPGGESVGSPGPAGASLPKAFLGRVGDHIGPRSGGASRRTEAAVAAALRWLAVNQTQSGRWDPRRLDAGFGAHTSGDQKHYEGTKPDTGITGLAISAFLASGQTHLSGQYRDNIRRGLEFLMSVQDPATGDLGATDNPLERMYCHAMATSALCEAYAMTGDKRLLPAVRLALDNTMRTQDRSLGSWRYPYGRAIDTHQIGWQVMALKSAEFAGLPMPAETRSGIARFLDSVSAARGDQSVYQAASPLASRPMTAEALAARQFLGLPERPEAMRASYDYLLQEPPGVGLTNHHYWYFATLALHQAQGDPWRRWNESLQKTLLATQRVEGSWAGSWDPDAVWGRCCGRVFSTALCTLSLEVYYRYLPPYAETAGRSGAAGR